jgi:hypothetical protein
MYMWSEDARSRNFVTACGVLGPLMLLAYFAAPLFVPPLARLVYASHPTTAQVLAVATRYHELLYAGTWLQATGALLAVVFLLALAALAAGTRSVTLSVTQVGAATLLAVVLAEAVFTLTWVSAAVNGQAGSSRTSFDLMASFIRVFPLIPAPAIYISLGLLLVRAHALPRAFARLALVLGAAFAISGFVGVMVPSATAATAALAGVQALWIPAAALVFDPDEQNGLTRGRWPLLARGR